MDVTSTAEDSISLHVHRPVTLQNAGKSLRYRFFYPYTIHYHPKSHVMLRELETLTR
jgi:hypothetical protein